MSNKVILFYDFFCGKQKKFLRTCVSAEMDILYLVPFNLPAFAAVCAHARKGEFVPFDGKPFRRNRTQFPFDRGGKHVPDRPAHTAANVGMGGKRCVEPIVAARKTQFFRLSAFGKSAQKTEHRAPAYGGMFSAHRFINFGCGRMPQFAESGIDDLFLFRIALLRHCVSP
jgi:hypothetical protein